MAYWRRHSDLSDSDVVDHALSSIPGAMLSLGVLFRQLIETGEHGVENGLGVQRLDEPEAKFAGDLSEGTGDSKQVHARDPGDVLAGVGVSFAKARIGVGAAPELALPGKLGAL